MKFYFAITLAALLLAGQANASSQAEIDRKTKELESLDSISNVSQQNLLQFETVELFKEKFMQNRAGKVNTTADLQDKYQTAIAALDFMIANKAKCMNPALSDSSCNTMKDSAQIKVAQYLRIAPPPVPLRSRASAGAPEMPTKRLLEEVRRSKEAESQTTEVASKAMEAKPPTPHEERKKRFQATTAKILSLKKVDPEKAARTNALLAEGVQRKSAEQTQQKE